MVKFLYSISSSIPIETDGNNREGDPGEVIWSVGVAKGRVVARVGDKARAANRSQGVLGEMTEIESAMFGCISLPRAVSCASLVCVSY